MRFYMAVTTDRYELPLFCAESLAEMSAWSGKTKRSILSELARPWRHPGARRGWRFIRLDLPDEDDERKHMPCGAKEKRDWKRDR